VSILQSYYIIIRISAIFPSKRENIWDGGEGVYKKRLIEAASIIIDG
jgi:hypothetical protein